MITEQDIQANATRKLRPVGDGAIHFRWGEFLGLVREEMYRQKITQEALAADLNLSRGQVANFLTGRTRMSIERFLTVCDWLKIDPFQYLEFRP